MDQIDPNPFKKDHLTEKKRGKVNLEGQEGQKFDR